MKIGIDIDDTILYTAKTMFKYADLYVKELSEEPANKDCMGSIRDSYYLNAYYGWDNNKAISFFNKYYKQILNECSMMPNVDKVLSKLKNNGNTIHFITSRLTNIAGCNTEEITKNCLKEFNIPYDDLNLHVSNKINFFKSNNIDICIEDSYETCRKMTDNGIKSILMTTNMNKNVDSKDITRVNSWDEIYEEIGKYQKNGGI